MPRIINPHSTIISNVAERNKANDNSHSNDKEIAYLQGEDNRDLLSRLCIDAAKVSSRQELSAFIDQWVNELGTHDHLLCVVSKDNITYHYQEFESVKSEQAGLAESFPIAGGPVEVVLNSPFPVIFNGNEILKQSNKGGPNDNRLRSLGKNGLVGIALRVGTNSFGVLWTNANIIDMILMQTISSQISIALAHLRANEEIEKQTEQIQNLKKELLQGQPIRGNETKTIDNSSTIIGISPSMEKALRLVSQVSKTQSTVLLLGETGTGKGVIAKAIHGGSLRKDEAMVTINCAALPANLIESELFGHEKGSYTGAVERRIGKWELAHNGTLFLDEIGDMPLDLQVKLLRALQEKEIERVGGRTVIKTDVRVIAATNKDLRNEVRQGKFRSDLFFRLNIFPITIPPLRERKPDIPALSLHFVEQNAKKSGRQISGISRKVLKQLSAYSWPGNVRELENVIERSVLLSSMPIIDQVHLPVGEENIESVLGSARIKTMDEVEREHIMSVLKSFNGKVSGPGGAAEALKMPPTTLHSMIKRLGIRKSYSE